MCCKSHKSPAHSYTRYHVCVCVAYSSPLRNCTAITVHSGDCINYAHVCVCVYSAN